MSRRAWQRWPTGRGVPKSAEHRRKIGDALRGKPKSEAHRKATGLASRLSNCGSYTRTPETRARLSASIIKYLQKSSVERRKGTSIEIAVQQGLERVGIDFVSNVPVAGVLVDIYLPFEKLVIECDGCYWHCCPVCKIHTYHPDHLRKVHLRDSLRCLRLEAAGYSVLRFWQHDIRKRLDHCIEQVLKKVRQ